LLDIDGFLQRFITPIVKVTKGKSSKTFFTLPEFEAWKAQTENGKGYTTKYYKGLGTSTNAEAKDYFSNLDQHEINFATLADDVAEISLSDDDNRMVFDENAPDVIPSRPITGTDCIDLAFNKARVEDRKAWLNRMKADTYLDYAEAQKNGGIQYSDFINKELILFSKADNIRSIPHIMDGFKPSQRKVLYACFKRKLKGEIKVAQLAGYIGEHSAYHHGEASLAGTIINLAQTFCGANNVNLLTPAGQFGTRRLGGKDHASPRYIFTSIEKVTRTIFHPDDDALLRYLNDDGMSIEPEYYVPVIPTILVNGADGIGTGWSTKIPNYNPRDIINNLRRRIKGTPYERMQPWYSGFTGEINSTEKEGTYNVIGRIERVDETTLVITELPLKFWTQDYKELLEKMLLGDGKKLEPEITDFKENHTDDTVHFIISASKEKIDEFELDKNGLLGKFKLASSLSTTNMTLFDPSGRILKYENPEGIMESFFSVRMDFYIRRKAMLLEALRREQRMLSNKARFVEEVCKGELVVNNRKRKELLYELQSRKYDLFDKTKTNSQDQDSETEDEEASDSDLARGYEYLLGMKIWSLTFEKVRQLRQEFEEKTRAVEILESTNPTDIWLSDLDAIEVALVERDDQIRAAQEDERQAQIKNKKHKQRKSASRAKKAKSKNKANVNLSISGSDEDFGPTKKPAAMKKIQSKTEKSSAVQVSKDREVIEPKSDSNNPFGQRATNYQDKDPTITITSSIADEIDEIAPKNKGKKRLSPRYPESSGGDSKMPVTKKKGTTAVAKRAPKPAPIKAPKSKKVKKYDLSDSEQSADGTNNNLSVEEIAPIQPRSRSARSVATSKKVAYTVDSSSSEAEDDVDVSSDSDF